MAVVKNICVEAIERHCSSGETGRLDIRNGNHEGRVFTAHMFLVHAELSGLEGVPALFRMLDWGDVETIWNPGVTVDKPSLNLPMEAACVLYAEYLQERATLEPREKDFLDQSFVMPDYNGAIESVLKYYTLSLECSNPELLPGGFIFTDAAKSSYVIGSGDDCDVIIRHSSIDPLHCGIILEKGSVYFWDLGGQSGIRLNGTPINEGTLKVGDTITLGAVDVQFRIHLRRPTLKKSKTVPIPVTPIPVVGPPPKVIPKGAITYDKLTRQLKNSGKAQPFLTKLGSLFGSKDRK
ncbi:MAG TPA: FHA domain-containing protein [Candidatus Methylacidiphilales bacterium]|nr:FHA domain-containing protein [Candidatus Methylacidiphilales bacterium]